MRKVIPAWAVVCCVVGASVGEILPSQGPFEDANHLLKCAAERILDAGQPTEHDEYQILFKVSRDLARYDRSLSKKLLAKAFEAAKATKDDLDRAFRFEMVGLYAAPIDEKLSTAALLEVKVPQGYEIRAYTQLKLLAIDLVVAHRQDPDRKKEVLDRVKKFCSGHSEVHLSDIVSSPSSGLADYVALHEPELGRKMWMSLLPERAWEQRLEMVRDLVHYAPASAVGELRYLLNNAPDKEAKAQAAVMLYYAGERTEASSIIADLEAAVGLGQPVGDLLKHTACYDGNEAMKLALNLGSEMSVRDGVSIVLTVIAERQPKDLQRFLKKMDNAHRRSRAVVVAVQSLVKMGEIESARELAGTITVGQYRCAALASVAEASEDRGLMYKSLESAFKEDIYGRGLKSVTSCAIRGFGIDETKKMLLQAKPNLETKWDDRRMFAVLTVVVNVDRAWALEVFKRGPVESPRRNWDVAGHSVSRLIPLLVRADPNFIEKYLSEHGSKWEPKMLAKLKKECVDQIAKESLREARAFAKNVGVSLREPENKELELLYRASEVLRSPKDFNQIVKSFELHHPSEKEIILWKAVDFMFGVNDCDIKEICELAGALDDRALEDKVLVSAVWGLFQQSKKKEAYELVEKIESPWRAAEAFETMAYLELVPRPRERWTFLAGWPRGRRQ